MLDTKWVNVKYFFQKIIISVQIEHFGYNLCRVVLNVRIFLHTYLVRFQTVQLFKCTLSC